VAASRHRPLQLSPEVIEWAAQNRDSSAGLQTVEERALRACERWRLEPRERLHGGLTSLVLDCEDDLRRSCVLKVSVAPELFGKELRALRFWRGVPSLVQLRAADARSGVLLLERIMPGTPVRRLDAERQTIDAVASVFATLHARGGAPHRLPPLTPRIELRLRLISAALPRDSANFLGGLAADLLAQPAPSAPLHGDPGQGNLLASGGEGLVAIDPRGYHGERAYDLAVWAQKRGVEGALERAEDLARTLGVDVARTVAWTRFRCGSHAAHMLLQQRPAEAAAALRQARAAV
jgi:streptomycin 6-kinase